MQGKKEELLKLARAAWDGRDDGTHGWLPLGDGRYITVEPMNDGDGEGDYLMLAVVEEVDALGYPLTEYLSFTMLEEGFHDQRVFEDFDWLIREADAYGRRNQLHITALKERREW